MSNPLFQAFGGGQMDMATEFQKFVQQMRDKDPNQEINRLLQSGQITQAQLNQAQQMAHQMSGFFGLFRK